MLFEVLAVLGAIGLAGAAASVRVVKQYERVSSSGSAEFAIGSAAQDSQRWCPSRIGCTKSTCRS
jgi:hypothetical protein